MTIRTQLTHLSENGIRTKVFIPLLKALELLLPKIFKDLLRKERMFTLLIKIYSVSINIVAFYQNWRH